MRRCGELTSNTQKEREKAAALHHLLRLSPFLWFSENFPVAGNGDLGGFLSIKNGRSVRVASGGRRFGDIIDTENHGNAPASRTTRGNNLASPKKRVRLNRRQKRFPGSVVVVNRAVESGNFISG